MSMEVRLLKDKGTGESFIPVTHWDAISNKPEFFSGDYDDLTNKPTLADALIQTDWNLTNSSAKDYIKNKPTNISNFINDAGYLTSHQDVSGKEDKSNKIESLSELSTNTEYPSASAVWDLLPEEDEVMAIINGVDTTKGWIKFTV